jgi:uncharacterized lipoprotein NlpE involved in copper resistance
MNCKPIILITRQLFQTLVITCFLLVSGCIKNPNHLDNGDNATQILTQSHNSSNSLDWMGEYRGILPCADCEGIETIITLNKDMSYSIQTKYIGKSEKAFTNDGEFEWGNNGNSIILHGIENSPNSYFVGENYIIQLDMSGNRITGPLAEKYRLNKLLTK